MRRLSRLSNIWRCTFSSLRPVGRFFATTDVVVDVDLLTLPIGRDVDVFGAETFVVRLSEPTLGGLSFTVATVVARFAASGARFAFTSLVAFAFGAVHSAFVPRGVGLGARLFDGSGASSPFFVVFVVFVGDFLGVAVGTAPLLSGSGANSTSSVNFTTVPSGTTSTYVAVIASTASSALVASASLSRAARSASNSFSTSRRIFAASASASAFARLSFAAFSAALTRRRVRLASSSFAARLASVAASSSLRARRCLARSIASFRFAAQSRAASDAYRARKNSARATLVSLSVVSRRVDASSRHSRIPIGGTTVRPRDTIGRLASRWSRHRARERDARAK
tara:strand:- start:154 stop:1170 length:1017 start_codon:yes stop_codon:yes gene_type:complete